MGDPKGAGCAVGGDCDDFKDAARGADEEEDEDQEDGGNDEEEGDEEGDEKSRIKVQTARALPEGRHSFLPHPYYGYPPAAEYSMSHLPLPQVNSSNYPFPTSKASTKRSNYVDNARAVDPIPDQRRNRGGVVKPFPEVLHIMLSALEVEGNADVASFFSHGRAFAIHKPRVFVSDAMPRFFKQTKLTSFQRQLNLYGFKRISSGAIDNGGYWHPLFLKGREGLCVNMKRIKVKGSKGVGSEEDPNFYTYPPIKDASLPANVSVCPSSAQLPGYPPPPPPYGYVAYPPWPNFGYAPPSLYQAPPHTAYAAQPSAYSSYPPTHGYPFGQWDPALRQMPLPSPVHPVGRVDDTPSKPETPSVSDTPIRFDLPDMTPSTGVRSVETLWKSGGAAATSSSSVAKSDRLI